MDFFFFHKQNPLGETLREKNGVVAVTPPAKKIDAQRVTVYWLKNDETEVPEEDTLQCISIRHCGVLRTALLSCNLYTIKFT